MYMYTYVCTCTCIPVSGDVTVRHLYVMHVYFCLFFYVTSHYVDSKLRARSTAGDVCAVGARTAHVGLQLPATALHSGDDDGGVSGGVGGRHQVEGDARVSRRLPSLRGVGDLLTAHQRQQASGATERVPPPLPKNAPDVNVFFLSNSETCHRTPFSGKMRGEKQLTQSKCDTLTPV